MDSATGATTTTDVATFVINSCDMDWQSTKGVLRERFEYLFQNELLCDVHFIVGSGSNAKKLGAHKLVLSAGSVIFFTMFSEKWSTNHGEVIKVSDVEPPAFIEMLRFLYSDNVVLTSENVFAVLYTARKYSILALENECVDYLLLSKLCPENAFEFLIQGRLLHVQKLVDACLEVIAENTVDTFKTRDFCNIDVETLFLILERSDLRIDESELFKAVLRWSEAACKKELLPINAKTQREVLKNSVSLVRFPLMKPEYFQSKVVASGILSETETLSVMCYFINKSKGCLFSDIPRRTFPLASRFQSIVYGGPYGSPSSIHKLEAGRRIFSNRPHFLKGLLQDSCANRALALRKLEEYLINKEYYSIEEFIQDAFSSDTAIRLVGIGLYGSPDHLTVHPVDVILREQKKSEVLHQVTGIHNGSKEIFRVMFEQPYELTADKWYSLEVKIEGEYMRYGCDGKEKVTVNINADTKVVIQFQTTAREKIESEEDRGRKTSMICGQIPEILFEV